MIVDGDWFRDKTGKHDWLKKKYGYKGSDCDSDSDSDSNNSSDEDDDDSDGSDNSSDGSDDDKDDDVRYPVDSNPVSPQTCARNTAKMY